MKADGLQSTITSFPEQMEYAERIDEANSNNDVEKLNGMKCYGHDVEFPEALVIL